MKKVIAAALLLAATTLTAQVTESIDVRIVNVDVTVTSKGAPVRGLTRDDFEILEDGHAQKITNFYSVDEPTRAKVATAPTVAPSAEAPATETDPRFRRKVLVLVDNRHTSKHQRDIALRELEAMINDRFHGEYDWSIGLIGRGVTLILPLSSDKKAIHEALEMIRRSGTRQEGATTFAGAADAGEHPIGDQPTGWSVFDTNYAEKLDKAVAMDATEQVIAAKFTVPAYLDAVRGFASTSGRKIVLLMTGDPGFNDQIFAPNSPTGREGMTAGITGSGAAKTADDLRTMDDLRKSIVREANSSDVSFYIWNVEGLLPLGGLGVSGSGMTDNSAVFWLSKQTGGRLVAGNDAAAAVHEFDTASSTFYSLGYAPTHPDDGKYHSISVRLKQKGNYSLEYRTGYSGTPAAAQLARAMTSPTAAAMLASALPVTMTLGSAEGKGREVTVPIAVKVPFRSLQFLPGKRGVAAKVVVYVSVFDDAGKNLVASNFPLTPAFTSGVPDANGSLVYRNAIKLRKGERHRVVVAVRDTITDSVGMATEVVKF
ncbi:MAG TPA: VWA domain-containing protein [Thermoanaerobaculia bacterium]|jgi:VWFA-related protein|nr:VWA domain-containing protein [Thermoanaerobaculia bacterium]